MKVAPETLGPAAQAAVAALVLLGLFGGCLIVAYAGFATSPKRGGYSTFVPVPEAYLLAATLIGMSGTGLLVLLRHRHASHTACALAGLVYVAVAAVLTSILRPE
ncbi:hypothetical protein [Leptothrix discophora]|uniref:Uncharacterized protein n=1 Tax=Leptothrix discophora TaxID=89 RepID=A0ABT9G4W0_LEPDI|nr:hypothetical protein [Leptothrix discophora]MDP4301525.1 hypothetical protein [Leptothrix discophora]